MVKLTMGMALGLDERYKETKQTVRPYVTAKETELRAALAGDAAWRAAEGAEAMVVRPARR